MKRIGVILLLLGVIFIGSAYAGYPLAVVSSPTTSTYNLDGMIISLEQGAIYPSSTNLQSPTLFPSASSVVIEAVYGSYYNGQSIITHVPAPSGKPAYGVGYTTYLNNTFSVDVKDMTTGTTHAYPVYSEFYLWVYPVLSSLNYPMYYDAQITLRLWTTFDNTGTPNTTYQFMFSTISSSSIFSVYNATFTFPGSSVVYGEFPVTSGVINMGHFYIGNATYSSSGYGNMTKIASSTQVINLDMRFPGYLTVMFVEDNGTMNDFRQIYYLYHITYSSNGTSSLNQMVTLFDNFDGASIGSPQTVYIDGKGPYTAYISQIPINNPMTITINGTVVSTLGQSFELMEITGNYLPYMPAVSSYSLSQYISFGIGAVLILIGAVWIFKR